MVLWNVPSPPFRVTLSQATLDTVCLLISETTLMQPAATPLSSGLDVSWKERPWKVNIREEAKLNYIPGNMCAVQ